jgi:hypothetical protein
MHHLPHLALPIWRAATRRYPGEFAISYWISSEQILRVGASTGCSPWTLAIPGCDILVAWDLFRAGGMTFDDGFETETATP